MATYYVTTSGSDSNNGLTEGTAFATPGYAAGQATTAGDIVYVKEGTYTLTSTSANVSGGTLNISRAVIFQGYKTTAGDLAARPVINAGTQVVTSVISFNSPNYNTSGTGVRSIEVDGNNNATYGINASSPFTGNVENCIARNCSTGFLGNGSPTGFFGYCSALDCSLYGYEAANVVGCHADSCGVGFGNLKTAHFGCIASNCTNQGFYSSATYPFMFFRCVAVNNGSDGFRNGFNMAHMTQCISSGNGGYGYYFGGTNSSIFMTDCADYNNTSGRSINTSTSFDIRPINLTTDPFTSASTGDFTLNNDAGGGAELRQIQLSGLAGVNGVFDVGAIDAVVTAGGGGAVLHPLRSN